MILADLNFLSPFLLGWIWARTWKVYLDSSAGFEPEYYMCSGLITWSITLMILADLNFLSP